MNEFIGTQTGEGRSWLISRRDFIAVALGCPAVAGAAGEVVSHGDGPVLGPILGHVDATRAVVWMRVDREGRYEVELTEEEGRRMVVEGRAEEGEDLCVHWRVEGLKPSSRYRYRVLSDGKPFGGEKVREFVTPAEPEVGQKVVFGISSCALEDEGSREVWKRMAEENVDAVVLIGDTPYIDSTDLAVQTRRHREFAAVEEYRDLLEGRPCWWTWDDHDFAANDSDGRVEGKENSRRVFVRYRPMWSHGEKGEGIHTSFRRGPVEVFLLDTRWFSMTGPSYADAGKPTLLGSMQWEWLKRGLKESTAAFKFIACGMIWDDKENREKDDWGSYLHERGELERWIARERISGVVLMGGDIHASRVLRYPTKEKVGYDMVQFIASPIHHKVIPKLNVYHPDLVRSAVEPNVFLKVEVDSTVVPASMKAELVNRHGHRVFTYQLTSDDLTPF